ncbi:hypothetical protein [Kordia sp.]|uniref:hypothetical protein n=1 Tax=Kordia sp. TaxID=1965332 RepID=UPI0025BBD554|nr:hypothetical protein [Kordia sp.]MCH2196938.1 hypothetical protein [Kordia sp.]
MGNYIVIFIARLQIRYFFGKYKNTLPTKSTVDNPKMKYYPFEGDQGIVGWEDEGFVETPFRLGRMLSFVLAYRTYLIETPPEEFNIKKIGRFHSKAFRLGKKYFPNWIGFQEARCTYNPVHADRIKRYRKVTEWKIEKLLSDDGA